MKLCLGVSVDDGVVWRWQVEHQEVHKAVITRGPVWYLNRCLVTVLDEAVGGVVDMVDISHVTVSSGSTLALRDNMDASECRRDAIPFSLLSARVP